MFAFTQPEAECAYQSAYEHRLQKKPIAREQMLPRGLALLDDLVRPHVQPVWVSQTRGSGITASDGYGAPAPMETPRQREPQAHS